MGILARNRSLSDSIDSRKSDAWSEAPATPPLTPVGPPDHFHTSSDNAPDQLMAVNEEERETSPSPPPPAPKTPEPVPSAADADRPKCDNCGKSFGSKAAIASHVKVCWTGVGERAGSSWENEACADEHSLEAAAHPQITSHATNTRDDGRLPASEPSEAGNGCRVEVAVEESPVNCSDCNKQFQSKSERESH